MWMRVASVDVYWIGRGAGLAISTPIPVLLERTLDKTAICLRTLPQSSQPLLRLPAAWDPLPSPLPVPPDDPHPVFNLQRLAARTDVSDAFNERRPYAHAPRLRNPPCSFADPQA
ncbi:hypothetical protein HGRIS_004340 [Hohenbuehelia grisea]|uniref:Uncharacterized protein n=1 Tax=Hohenbuehelia grisea TaxID=104357 RepID=A0ABR3IPH8_9AGAR